MLKVFFTFFFFTLVYHSTAQYYIRGDVKDEKNQPLQNVKIYMPSTHSIYYSGGTGGFGIPGPNLIDSLIFSAEGYETRTFKIKCNVYQEISLKPLPSSASIHTQKLSSFTIGTEGHLYPMAYYNNESYSSLLKTTL